MQRPMIDHELLSYSQTHRTVTHIRATSPKYECHHASHSQPLWNGLNKYPTSHSHDFREGRTWIVYAIHLCLFEGRRGVNDFRFYDMAIRGGRSLEVSKRRATSRAACHGPRVTARVSSAFPRHSSRFGALLASSAWGKLCVKEELSCSDT
jgi:hypothetical protein